jgi:hypothetical protein
MEGGPYQEYFYIEIPQMGGADGVHIKRRYVYVHEEGASGFPMQFGTEVRGL